MQECMGTEYKWLLKLVQQSLSLSPARRGVPSSSTIIILVIFMEFKTGYLELEVKGLYLENKIKLKTVKSNSKL